MGILVLPVVPDSEAPSGSCDTTWGHGAFSLGSSWWQRDVGTRDFEQEE